MGPPKNIVSDYFILKDSLRSEACHTFSPTPDFEVQIKAEFAEKKLEDIFYEQFLCDKIRDNISDKLNKIASTEAYEESAYQHYIQASDRLFSIMLIDNATEVTPLGQDSSTVHCSDQ